MQLAHTGSYEGNNLLDHVVKRNVLPEVERNPPQLSKFRVLKAISFRISRELAFPPFPVIQRNCSVLHAAVPEATINEDRQAGAGEHDIWRSWQIPALDPEPKSSGM